MALQDLMQSVIANHSATHLRHQLERNDLRLWQRDTEAELNEQIETKLRQLNVERSPHWLVSQLCTKEGLIAIMKDQFPGDPSGADLQVLSMSELTKRVLEAFGIPLPPQYRGIYRISTELESYKRRVDQYIRQGGHVQRGGRQEQDMLRGVTISCWTYLEDLLKQVLGFYAVHFGRIADTIAKELRTAFVEVCRVRTEPLGRIIKAFEEIEFIFRNGESQHQRKDRERRFKEELRRANGAPSVVERTRMEDETARQQGRDVARRLEEECKDAFGRPSPFSSFQVHEIRKLTRRYRNPYAHETIDRLMRDDPTGNTARQSITSALNLVDDLRSNGIAPRLVFLVAEGSDAYGRRFISYVGEENIDNEGMLTNLLNDTMHFFHNTLQFEPLTAYLIMERQGSGRYYEPPVYSYKDVEASISQ